VISKEETPAVLIEDNHGATFKDFTVNGGAVLRNNNGSDFSNFKINQAQLPVYAEWKENITRDAGSSDLVKKDFDKMRLQLDGHLPKSALTEEQKVEIIRRWILIEQAFMSVANDRTKTLELLSQIGFEGPKDRPN
jgi:hypothetical protein